MQKTRRPGGFFALNNLPSRSVERFDAPLNLFNHSPNGSISGPPVRTRQQGIMQKAFKMPKVKTNSSAKKRFKITGTGEISFQRAFKRHILTKKSKKRKRNLNKKGIVHHANTDFVKRLLRLK